MPFKPNKISSKVKSKNPFKPFSDQKAAALSAASPQNPDRKKRPGKQFNSPAKGFDTGFSKAFMGGRGKF